MFLKYLKEYAIMTLGLAVFVFGWTAFLNPHEITGGGIAASTPTRSPEAASPAWLR